MANTLRFKRGLVSGIPTAALGEPLFTTDTFDLYIGNGTTNTRFQKYIASGTTSQILRGDGSLYTFPLNISSPSNGQVLKYDGTNWVNSADAGVTGSGTAGQVTYWDGTGTITGESGFTWDATNKRLRLGSTGGAPIYFEDTDATSTFNVTSISNNGGNFNIETRSSAGAFVSADYQLVKDTASSSYHRWFTAASTERMRLFNTGNLVLNSTTDNGLRFQVTGDGYFSGRALIGTSSFVGSEAVLIATNSSGTFTQNLNLKDLNASANNNLFLVLRKSDDTYLGGLKRAGTSDAVALYGNSFVSFETGFVQRMLLDASGNLGLGVTPNTWFTGNSFRALQTTNGASFSGALIGGEFGTIISNNWFANAAGSNAYIANGVATQYLQISGEHRFFTAVSGTANATFTFTEQMRITRLGNLHIGTFSSDTGERLQVNGTMRVSGASTFNANSTISLNQNAVTKATISNTTSGTGSRAELEINSSNGTLVVGKYSATTTTYKTFVANDGTIYNGVNGNLSILNDVSGGSIILTAGASSTAHFTIASTGAATFSSSVTANSLYSANELFLQRSGSSLYLSVARFFDGTANPLTTAPKGDVLAIGNQGGNSLVFVTNNTNRGSFDSSGNFSILNAATFSSSVTAANLYSTGASNFATSSGNVGIGTAIPGYKLHVQTSGASGTSFGLRVQAGTNSSDAAMQILSQAGSTYLFLRGDNNLGFGTSLVGATGTNTMSVFSGTAPTTNVTDSFQMYSNDIVAGNAAPHFRTENGAVIKLYQQDNSIAAANFVAGIGTSVTTLDAFDGYTIGQVVKALRNAGILL